MDEPSSREEFWNREDRARRQGGADAEENLPEQLTARGPDAVGANAPTASRAGKLAGRVFLIVFAAFFTIIPLSMAVTVLRQAGSKVPWPVALGLVVFLVPFLAVPVVIFLALRRTAARSRAASNAALGGEPWKQRPDWEAGRIELQSTRGAATVLGLFALMWNAIVFVTGYAALTRPNPAQPLTTFYLVFGVFVLVGLGLAWGAAVYFVRWRRFGTSVFELTTVPGVIGGRLAGRVLAKLRPSPATEFRVALRCMRRTTTSSNNGRETQERIVWEDTQIVHGSQVELGPGGGVFIPVVFVVPRECEPTTAVRTEDGIFWQLVVSAKLEGPDYEAMFVVPVFVTAESDSPEAERLETQARRARLENGQPVGLSVRINPTITGGTEIYWPPLRRKFVGAVMVIISAGFFVGCVLAWPRAAIPIPLFLALFGLVLAAIAFNVLFISTRLALEPDGRFSVERRWLGLGSRREFDARNVAVVERVVASTSGNTPGYTLQIRMADGTKLSLGNGLEREDETAWLEAMIEDWVAGYQPAGGRQVAQPVSG
jgi:hypothetical protein